MSQDPRPQSAPLSSPSETTAIGAAVAEAPVPQATVAAGDECPATERAKKNRRSTDKTAVKVWRTGQCDDSEAHDGSTTGQDSFGKPHVPMIIGRQLRRVLDRQGLPTDWNRPEPVPAASEVLLLDWGCDVTEAPVSWLWEGRIPRGGLTLLAAHETQTASLVAQDLAARVSRGAGWSDAPGAPAGENRDVRSEGTAAVVYISPREARASRTVPGLKRAGADMSRVLCLDGVCRFLPRGGKDAFPIPVVRPLQLPIDGNALRQAIGELHETQLLVLDPIEAFFHKYGNSRTPRETADLLREIAWDLGLAVVAVTRLKALAGNRRAVPAIENPKLAAAAAATWGIVPTARSEQQHLLFPIHCAVANTGPALTFDLAGAPEARSVNWNAEPFEMTAADFADERNASVKFAIAAAWLKGLLTERPHSKEEIDELAGEFGISPTMIRKLQKELRIKMEKSGYQGKSVWRLPNGPQSETDPEAPKFEEGRQSLEETGEISKLEPDEAPTKV